MNGIKQFGRLTIFVAEPLVDMGAPVSVAQVQLRHEDPSVTLGTYSHVLGDSQREYAEKVAELLDYSGLQKPGPTQLIQ